MKEYFTRKKNTATKRRALGDQMVGPSGSYLAILPHYSAVAGKNVEAVCWTGLQLKNHGGAKIF